MKQFLTPKQRTIHTFLTAILLSLISCKSAPFNPQQLRVGRKSGTSPQFPASHLFGTHAPQGFASVDHAYGPKGMWKSFQRLEYRWNYYPQFSESRHPCNKTALLAYANGSHFTTARDANGHLLFRMDQENEVNPKSSGAAFHEHNGLGKGEEQKASPFTQFWYDDNHVASYMSLIYERPYPSGLFEFFDFGRWSVLGGKITNWTPYEEDNPDQLSLDGLFFIFSGQIPKALHLWQKVLNRAGAQWDQANQLYRYLAIHENYHLGLMRIFNELLMNSEGIIPETKSEMLQHGIALHSHILFNQEKKGSEYLGWISDINSSTALMNIESLAINTLALGVNALATYQPGLPPFQPPKKGFTLSPYFILSTPNASTQDITPSLMLSLVDMKVQAGHYKLEITLRSPVRTGKLLSVVAKQTSPLQILAQREIHAEDIESQSRWTRVTVPLEVVHPESSTDIQVFWQGIGPVDLATLRVIN